MEWPFFYGPHLFFPKFPKCTNHVLARRKHHRNSSRVIKFSISIAAALFELYIAFLGKSGACIGGGPFPEVHNMPFRQWL